MSASTPPAPLPVPGSPAGSTSGTPANPTSASLLGALLTPVTPARTPPADAQNGPTGPQAASSSAFHTPVDDTTNTAQNSATEKNRSSAGKTPPSVIRAWLLAGAERWRKGADAKLKRLDVKKAQASADAALARKAPVNQLPKQPSGSSASGAGSKPSKPAPAPKSPPAPRPGPAPKAPSSPASSSSSSAPRKAPAPVPAPGPKAPAPAPKQSKPQHAPAPAPAPKQHKSASSSTTATNPAPATKAPKPTAGPQAPAGGGSTPTGNTSSAGTPNKPQKPTQGSGTSTTGPSKALTPQGSTGTHKGPTPTTSAGTGKGSTAGSSTSSTPKPSSPTPAPAPGPTTAPGSTSPKASDTPANGSAGRSFKAGHTNDPAKPLKHPQPQGPTSKSNNQPTGPTTPINPKTPPAPAPHGAPGAGPKEGKTPGQLRTKSSRETGYRDGHRAGVIAAHTRAYGDGLRDGWDRALRDGEQEKQLLDQARDNRTTPTPAPAPVPAPRKDQPVPPTAPPKPTTPPADSRSPITVTSVDASHVHLGPEATAGSVTRGELRTFKDYERRLTVRHGDVGKVSDGMRALAQFAEERAAHATRLLEAAKTVKGGNNLGAVLARLEEQAKAQATLAVETLTRAARATDATGALLANVSTRYGGVFQAVVDSDETAPADLHFYKD